MSRQWIVWAVLVMAMVSGALSTPLMATPPRPAPETPILADEHDDSAEVGKGVVIADPPAVGIDGAPVGSVWPLVVGAMAALALFVALRGWALPDRPDRRQLPAAHLAALAIAMLLLGPIGATIAVGATGVRGDPDTLRVQGVAMTGAYTAQSIVLLVWLHLRRHGRDRPVERRLGDHDAAQSESPHAAPSPWRSLGVGVLAFALAWPIVAATVAIAGLIRLKTTGESTDQLAHETLKALHAGSGTWRIVVALLAAGAAPILEEVLFRGLIQPALRSVGAAPWTAITIVSTLFAAVHFGAVPPPAIAGLFVLGLAFGWARERTGGLSAPIVAHVLFNVGNLLLAGAVDGG